MTPLNDQHSTTEMNRIYQGKVSKAELLDATGNPIELPMSFMSDTGLQAQGGLENQPVMPVPGCGVRLHFPGCPPATAKVIYER